MYLEVRMVLTLDIDNYSDNGLKKIIVTNILIYMDRINKYYYNKIHALNILFYKFSYEPAIRITGNSTISFREFFSCINCCIIPIRLHINER